MLVTTRTIRHAGWRARPKRLPRRVYAGSAVTRRASSRFFLRRTTQQMTSRRLLADCLGAAVTLASIAGWATLLMLVGG